MPKRYSGLSATPALNPYMAEGVKGTEDCPPLGGANKQRLEAYMRRFNFEL
jgi:hypothetical protein